MSTEERNKRIKELVGHRLNEEKVQQLLPLLLLGSVLSVCPVAIIGELLGVDCLTYVGVGLLMIPMGLGFMYDVAVVIGVAIGYFNHDKRMWHTYKGIVLTGDSVEKIVSDNNVQYRLLNSNYDQLIDDSDVIYDLNDCDTRHIAMDEIKIFSCFYSVGTKLHLRKCDKHDTPCISITYGQDNSVKYKLKVKR